MDAETLVVIAKQPFEQHTRVVSMVCSHTRQEMVSVCTKSVFDFQVCGTIDGKLLFYTIDPAPYYRDRYHEHCAISCRVVRQESLHR